MAINPITSTRLKTFVLIGHSNADGFGSYANLVANYPSYAAKADPATDPANSYWPNVYVLTSAQPFPLQTGDGNVNVPSSASDVDWLEMTAANVQTPAGPHPHASPFNYPNIKGSCWPRYLWHLWPEFSPNWASGATGTFGSADWPSPADVPSGPWFNDAWPSVMCGIEVPLQYYWKNYWQEQVGVIKHAFPGSLGMADDDGIFPYLYLDPWVAGSAFTPADASYVPSAVDLTNGTKSVLGYDATSSYNYWTPADRWDWAPSTERFYKQLYDKIAAGAAELPDGTKLDIQLILPWMGDNDSAGRSQAVLEQAWAPFVKAIIKRLRADIDANDWSSKPANQIPTIWPEVFTQYVGPNDSPNFTAHEFMNGVLQGIAADEPFMATLPTADLNTMEDDSEDWFTNLIPAHARSHFGSNGYHAAALAVMDLFESMQVDPFDALDLDECITVEEMKTRVRRYYNKSRANTDCADEAVLLQHINAAMLHCLNHAGDNLWWLRRRMNLSLSAGQNTVVTLPRYVHRVLKIEDPNDVDYPLRFEQVGHASGGKLQILIHGAGVGTYYVHFISFPKDLTTDGQKIPVPKNIAEWICVETCRRIAASANHVPLQTHFEVESQKLMQVSMRSMAQVQRSKRDRLYSNRRMVNLSYKYRNRY